METIRLSSDNLVLRNLRDADFAAVLAYRSHPEVCRYIGDPMSAAEVAAHIAQRRDGWSRAEGEALSLAVELRDAAVAGEVLVRYLSAPYRQAEVGVALHPRYHRRGLGLEINVVLLRYCFEELGLHRVIGYIDVANEPSQRLAELVGLKREGLLRKNAYRHGEWRDEYLVAMLDEEWPANRGRIEQLLARRG